MKASLLSGQRFNSIGLIQVVPLKLPQELQGSFD